MELFLARRGFMKNKKQLVFSGVTAVLLATNGILGYNYHQDTKSLEKQIDQYREHNNELTLQYIDLTSYLEKQQGTVDQQKVKIKKLEKLNKYFVLKNEEIKLENKKLKVNIKKIEQKVEKMSKNQQKNSNKTVVLTGGQKGHGRVVNMEASAYVAMCKEGCTGKTRLGIDVRNTNTYKGKRVVAVDPRVIPLHSLLSIETKGEVIHAIAADTGGAIKGNKLDVLVSSESTARNFGRQKVKVTVTREGK